MAGAALVCLSGQPALAQQGPWGGLAAGIHGLNEAVHAIGPSAGCDHGSQGIEPACPATRTLTVVLRWPDKSSRFLQNPVIEARLLAPYEQSLGVSMPERIASRGDDEGQAIALVTLNGRESEARVDWHVSFEPSLQLPGMRHPRQSTVLSAGQTDTISWPPCGAPSLVTNPAPNALATESLNATDPQNAMLAITIDTAVVDLTDIWPDASGGHDREGQDALGVWTANDPSHSRMRMFGSTHGAPDLWSAYVPASVTDPARAGQPVSRVVFYPYEIESKDPPIGLRGPRHTLFYANKFLLSDCINRTNNKEPGTECHYTYNAKGEPNDFGPPPGFGPALERTGKRAIVLLPWYQGYTDTIQKGAELPDRTLSIMHLLESEGRVNTPPSTRINSPLVLSAFSGGGDSMMRNFEKYKDQVSAYWGLDPITHSYAGGLSSHELESLASWAKADPSHQVRIVSSMYENRWGPFFKGLAAAHVPASQVSHDVVQTTPAAMKWYHAEDPRDLGMWGLHQFTVNGGTQDADGHRVSYFEELAGTLP